MEAAVQTDWNDISYASISGNKVSKALIETALLYSFNSVWASTSSLSQPSGQSILCILQKERSLPYEVTHASSTAFLH
jgi:hypothetical protein